MYTTLCLTINKNSSSFSKQDLEGCNIYKFNFQHLTTLYTKTIFNKNKKTCLKN